MTCSFCHADHLLRDCPNIDEDQYALATCANCGDVRDDVEPRNNGTRECAPCWRESLRHGHVHGLHCEDGEAPVDGCPLCPTTTTSDDDATDDEVSDEARAFGPHWRSNSHSRFNK